MAVINTRRVKQVLLWGGGLFLVFFLSLNLTLYFALRNGGLAETIRQTLETQASQALGRPVEIGSVGPGFFTTLILEDVKIGEVGGVAYEGPLVTAERVKVNYNLRGLIWRENGLFGSLQAVEVYRPDLLAIHYEDFIWNFSDLYGKESQGGDPLRGFRARVRIHEGRVAVLGIPMFGGSLDLTEVNGWIDFGPAPRLPWKFQAKVAGEGAVENLVARLEWLGFDLEQGIDPRVAVRAGAPKGGSLELNGYYDLNTRNWEAWGESPDARLTWISPWLFDAYEMNLTGGEARLSGRLGGGPEQEIWVQGEAMVKNGSFTYPVFGGQMEKINGRIQIDWLKQQITLSAVQGVYQGIPFLLGGVTHGFQDTQVALDLSVKSLDLTLLPQALKQGIDFQWQDTYGYPQGLAQVQAVITGAARDPYLQGTATLKGASWRSDRFPGIVNKVHGDVVLEGESVDFQRVAGFWEGIGFSVRGGVEDIRTLPRFLVEIEAKEIPILQALEGMGIEMELPITGSFSGQASLRGTTEDPLIRGNATGKGTLLGAPWKVTSLPFYFFDEEFEVAEAQGILAEGRVTSSGRISLGGESYFTVRGEELELGHWQSAIPGEFPWELSGKGSIRVALEHGDGGTSAVGTISTTQVILGPYASESLESGFWWNDGVLGLDYLTLISPPMTVGASGQVWPQWDLSIQGDSLDLEYLLGPWADYPVRGSISISGGLRGELAQIQFDGSVTGKNLEGFGVSVADLKGNLQGDAEGLKLSNLWARIGEGEHQVSGEVNWLTQKISGTWKIQGLEIASAVTGLGYDLPVSGLAAGQVWVEGRWDEPEISADLRLSQVEAWGERVEQVEFRGALVGQDLTLTRLVLKDSGGQAEVFGWADPESLQLNINLRGWPLENLALVQPYELAGRGTFYGTLRGTPQVPRLRGEVTVTDLQVLGQPLGRATGMVWANPDLLGWGPLQLESAYGAYASRGELIWGPDPLANLQVDILHGDVADIAGLLPWDLPKLEGRLAGTAQIKGPLSSPNIQVLLPTLNLRTDVGLVSGHLNLGLQNGRYLIHELFLTQDRGEINAQGYFTPSGEMAFSARARSLNLEILSLLGMDVSGVGFLEMELGGIWPSIMADVDLEIQQPRWQAYDLDSLVGKVTSDGETLKIKEVMAKRNNLPVRLSGSIPIAAAWDPEAARRSLDLRFQVDQGDLSLLDFLIPELDVQGGVLQADLAISGSWEMPQLTGVAQISHGQVRHSVLPTPMTNLQGTVTVRDGLVSLEGWQGRVSGGEVTLSGQATLSGFDLGEVDLSLKARAFPYKHPLVTTTVSQADLRLTGPISGAYLKGSLELTGSEIYIGSMEEGVGVEFPLNLDIQVTHRGDLRLKGPSGLDVPATGTLRVKGSLSQPTLTGIVETRRGRFLYLDSEFQVTEARAEFSEFRGIYPYLYAVGQTQTAVGTVTVQLSGVAPEDMRITLTSDPPLSEEEILAQLTLPRFQRIASLTQGDLQDVVTDEILRLIDSQVRLQLMQDIEGVVREAFRLDEFRLEPSLVSRNLRIQAGKYLIDGLYFTYARTLQAEGRESLRVEYRLNPYVQLQAGMDGIGLRRDFRLGVETRFRF